MPTTLPAGPRALFIYYSVASTDCAEVLRFVEALQQTLIRELPGLQARLWRRADEVWDTAKDQTWMEIYEHPQGLSASFDQSLAEHLKLMPPGRIGERHVEAFVPLNNPPSEGDSGAVLASPHFRLRD